MIYALDIETAPTKKTDKPYALEPYRVLTGESMITSVAIHKSDGSFIQLFNDNVDFISDLKKALTNLHGEIVFAHNALFDVAFLIATVGVEVLRPIRWRDTIILYKWLVNGQQAEEMNLSYALKACVKRVIKDHPHLEEFLAVKERDVKAGEDEEYWRWRGRLDAEMTCLLAEKLLDKMTPDMNPGFVVTCNAILPIAEGWVHGIPINRDEVTRYKQVARTQQEILLRKIGVHGSVLTSGKQLGDLLFNKWGLEPVKVTPKGTPSTDAESMLRLHHRYKDNENLDAIMKYRKLSTMLSKYIKGFENCMAYLGVDKMHASPRLLGTITGRMTYSSKIFNKDEFQVAIAQHQLPRKDKGIKRCMVPPPGYKVLYMDVSAQEGRIMAMRAPEPRMIDGYCRGIDLHSDLTEEIFGTPYDVILKANREGGPKEIVEQRQAGKLTGLSSFYRIGAKALAAKFFATYEYDISISTAQAYLTSFKRKYPGVPEYWRRAIGDAKQKGYAEAFGGWRYRIKTFDWKGESSAINHPIQGGGAIQTYATISVINKTWPQLILVSQVHDSLAYFVPSSEATRIAQDVKRTMDAYDYGKLLGFTQSVPIVLDVALGDNFADLTTIGV